MSYSCLVIETPKDCFSCPLCYLDFEDSTTYCSPLHKKVLKSGDIMESCPLQKMYSSPDNELEGVINEDYKSGYVDGWEVCLENLCKNTTK